MTINSRPYALFDLDGTLSRGFISLAFMDYIHDHYLYSDSAYAHQQDILRHYKDHSLSYDAWVDDWGRTWAQGLKGQQVSEVQQAARDFFHSYRDQIYPESAQLVSALKAHQMDSVMVSAGVYEVADLARASLGMDETLATRCLQKEGVYTGELETHLHTPGGKGQEVERLIAERGRPAYAFGDTSGDIPMLSRARVPVCLNPNQELADHARQEGWAQMPISQAPAFLEAKLQEGWLLAG